MVGGGGGERSIYRLVLRWEVPSCSKNIDDGLIKLAPSEEKIKTGRGGGPPPPSLIEAWISTTPSIWENVFILYITNCTFNNNNNKVWIQDLDSLRTSKAPHVPMEIFLLWSKEIKWELFGLMRSWAFTREFSLSFGNTLGCPSFPQENTLVQEPPPCN